MVICPIAMALDCPVFILSKANAAKAIEEVSDTIVTEFSGKKDVLLEPIVSNNGEIYGERLLNGQKLKDNARLLDITGAFKYAIMKFLSCFEIEDVDNYTQLKSQDEVNNTLSNILSKLSAPHEQVLAVVGHVFRSISAKKKSKPNRYGPTTRNIVLTSYKTRPKDSYALGIEQDKLVSFS